MNTRTVFGAAGLNQKFHRKARTIVFRVLCCLVLLDSGITGSAAAKEQTAQANSAGMLIISNKPQQRIRMGIDGERLWFWHTNQSEALAKYAVADLQVEYARVAINCAYELDLINVCFKLPREGAMIREVTLKSWHAAAIAVTDTAYDVEKHGHVAKLNANASSFSCTLKGQSLYCFRLNATELTHAE